ncbi:MAG: glutathione transferase GstA [Betaproteobacteria bacterium]
MKLYYSTAACSLAPHIALEEAGLPVELVKVDLRTHKLADGTDYYTINPKGYVPMLELDDGMRFSEVAVILQYIADRKPGTLAPVYGTIDRYRVNEWLNFIATEIHKQFGPLWHAETPDATKAAQRALLKKRFDLVAKTLAKQSYLTGDSFTIADAYLFTVVNWSGILKFDLAPWPALQQFQARVAARPMVHAAMKAEHLVRDPAPASA